MPADAEGMSRASVDKLVAFAGPTATIGTTGFDEAFLKAINKLVAVDHCTVLSYSRDTGLKPAIVSSRRNLSEARSLTRDYVSDHYRLDPNFPDLSRLTRSRSLIVRRHDPSRLKTRAYQQRFYATVGIVDKISYLWRTSDIAFYLNLYRTRGSGLYRDHEVALLEQIAPYLTSLLRQHCTHTIVQADIRSGRTLRFVERLVELAGEHLTAREHAVCSRILLGYGTEGIGLDLGVLPSSVATFRKRAYRKLGISSQTELFALCLRNLPRLMQEAARNKWSGVGRRSSLTLSPSAPSGAPRGSYGPGVKRGPMSVIRTRPSGPGGLQANALSSARHRLSRNVQCVGQRPS